MDLNGYYRTQGIVKYLEGDLEASRTYMRKADKELKSAEKSEIGYLQLEREWFEQLRRGYLTMGEVSSFLYVIFSVP